MAKFEKISRFSDIEIPTPVRKTAASAGYDFTVAEDVVIPPYFDILTNMERLAEDKTYIIGEMKDLTKSLKTRPTLVSTGMKCELDPGTYLELSVRSSSPLHYWIVMANSVGIIDADYYNNPDNEGEIFFQLINLSPYPIKLQKGDAIGQGIIKEYLTTVDDVATGARVGGFGSTNG